jgi:hypothetical protein
MSERYPDDPTLLTYERDPATGVPYIPTGKSPYYLDFRKLQYHLLRAAERANDLRVFQDGELSIGVRAGRAHLNNTLHAVHEQTGIAVSPNATTVVYLDSSGNIQTSTAGLPSDHTSFIPLAELTTDSNTIQTLTDRRGEAYLQIPSLATLGITAQAGEINQALAGINSSVDAASLNILTGGSDQDANYQHRHTLIEQQIDGEAQFALNNTSFDSAANMILALGAPAHLMHYAELLPNTNTGFLRQRYNNTTYDLVGSVHREFRHPGQLTGSILGRFTGVAPIAGVVSDVILSVRQNLQTSSDDDSLEAPAYANGALVTGTAPSLTVADGSGFRCTDQGDGTAAVMNSGMAVQVQRGDALSVDLLRSVGGSVSTELTDVAVLIVIRPSQPE